MTYLSSTALAQTGIRGSQTVAAAPKLKGVYYFESGLLTVLAAAHAATGGFIWLINPVGSGVVGILKKLQMSSAPTAATAFASSPRLRVERVTFTGTASGATVTPAARDSTDAAALLSLRTASTGLVLAAGAVVDSAFVQAVITAAGVAPPVDLNVYEAYRDEDDGIVLRAGEGLVIRQADAGTAADTRAVVCAGSWEER